MIDKILNKFGYYRKEDVRNLLDDPFTENELGQMYAESLGDFSRYTIDREEELQLFKDLSTVDGLGAYLRATVARDMQRHYGAQDDRQRDIINGAIARTMYLRSAIKGKSKPKTTKVEGINYDR